ncbi:MAG: hypothetical protein K0B81_04650 [Candidatus Cloacimonetes bacterium]|nr:hypothetical protein [Candidatus Cloacimonadota bacterium]
MNILYLRFLHPTKVQLVILIAIILLGLSLNLSAYSGSSLALAGSYSLRASGSEANYWNPANFAYPSTYDTEIMLINSYISLNNNALSIGKYNDYNGTYLTDKDKQDIVNSLQNRLLVNSSFSHYLLGFSFNRFAISSKINLFAQGNLSAKYVELLLLGNEYDRSYSFGKDKNNLEALGYIDFTIGFSPYSFILIDYLIHTGIALSYLTGLGVLTTEDYEGILNVSDDGVQLEQNITMKNGLSGYGFKSMIGFRSDINENLSIGLSIDNLAGFINWTSNTERRYYSASIDSLYIIDLDEDIFDHSEIKEEIGHFKTYLPVFTRISVLYRLENVDLSLDWKQGYVNSVLTSKTPEISMGTEYYLTPYIPLRMGFRPGLGAEPYNLTYGLGFETKSFEFNLGINSIGALIPSTYSKGIAVAISSKWRF